MEKSQTTTGTTPDRGVARRHPVLRAVGLGATSGVLATLVFLVVHAIAISDIWFSAPMVVVAGAGSGACLGWSHAVVFRRPSRRTWVTWNAVQTSLLLVLGTTSALVYSPRWSMAELMVDEPPLADLFAAALPLMFVLTAAGLALRVPRRSVSGSDRGAGSSRRTARQPATSRGPRHLGSSGHRRTVPPCDADE